MSLVLAALLLAAEAPAAAAPAPAAAVPSTAAPARYPIGRPLWTHYYPFDANARAEIEGAMAEAKAGGRLPVLVFGADWCGDSRALAAILTSEMWQGEFGGRYRVVFIDVDHPTKDHGRNEDLIARFGIAKMTGTPEMLVIGRDGQPLNSLKDAMDWENAGDRPVGAILKWFRELTPSKPH
ncbi:MAG: thioredoxin family protein [Proteobacteria bacterium]|nr:thioredoxin family protein [Pseudomonadota bacterium]